MSKYIESSEPYYLIIYGSDIYKALITADVAYNITSNYEQIFGDGGGVFSKLLQWTGLSTGQTTMNPKRQTSSGEFTLSIPTKLVAKDNPEEEISKKIKALHRMTVPNCKGGWMGTSEYVTIVVSSFFKIKEVAITSIAVTLSRALCTYGGKKYPIWAEVTIDIVPKNPLCKNRAIEMFQF